MSMATNKQTSNNGWLVVYCLAPARINFYNRDLQHTRRTLYHSTTVVELCMARYGLRLFYLSQITLLTTDCVTQDEYVNISIGFTCK